MEIVVIGHTAYSRSQTVENLRRSGHDVVAAAPRHRFAAIAEAPRDPGHAGRHLRMLLLGTAAGIGAIVAGIGGFWRHRRLAGLQQALGGHRQHGGPVRGEDGTG